MLFNLLSCYGPLERADRLGSIQFEGQVAFTDTNNELQLSTREFCEDKFKKGEYGIGDTYTTSSTCKSNYPMITKNAQFHYEISEGTEMVIGENLILNDLQFLCADTDILLAKVGDASSLICNTDISASQEPATSMYNETGHINGVAYGCDLLELTADAGCGGMEEGDSFVFGLNYYLNNPFTF